MVSDFLSWIEAGIQATPIKLSLFLAYRPEDASGEKLSYFPKVFMLSQPPVSYENGSFKALWTVLFCILKLILNNVSM